MRVDNSIIMAAGTSSRFAPLSYEKPKSLIEVRGEILIERQIMQLKEAGISDIYVITGYKSEQFSYLEGKYGVSLIHNPDYLIRNNHSSIYAARNVLGNSYICSADNYFTANPFALYFDEPYYSAVFADGSTPEWCMTDDAEGYIDSVTIGGHDSWYMMGHALWSKEFSRIFLAILEDEYDLPETRGKLWEHILIEHLDVLKMKVQKFMPGAIFEFDTLDELRKFDGSYKYCARSEVMRKVAAKLRVPEYDIVKASPLKGSVSEAEGFAFFCRGFSFSYTYKGGILNMTGLVRKVIPEDITQINRLLIEKLMIVGGGQM